MPRRFPIRWRTSRASISRSLPGPNSSGDPQQRSHFFLDYDDRFGLRQLGLQPSVLGSSSAIRLSRASGGFPFRPRLAGRNPSSSPASRCRRHVLKADENNPSRRSNAPSSPGFVHRSASRTIPRLYLALNCRRRLTIQRHRAGHSKGPACHGGSQFGGELLGRFHQSFSSGSRTLAERFGRAADSSPWESPAAKPLFFGLR